MEFFKIISEIQKAYSNDYCQKKNGTVFYGLYPGLALFARHTFFKGLTDDIIQKHLVLPYQKVFPKEYIEFLKVTNGMSLFGIRLYKNGKFYYAPRLLRVYGFPSRLLINGSYDSADYPDPYDLRIENLDRTDDIPNSWLKCGSYKKDYDFSTDYDIYIDTTSGHVYSCVRRKDGKIVDEWPNLDNCFCSLYEMLKDTKEEYDRTQNTGDGSMCSGKNVE